MLLIIEIALGIVLGFLLIVHGRAIIHYALIVLKWAIIIFIVGLVCMYLYNFLTAHPASTQQVPNSHTDTPSSLSKFITAVFPISMYAMYGAVILYSIFMGLKSLSEWKPITKLHSLLLETKYGSLSRNINIIYGIIFLLGAIIIWRII